jgi:hypothetical protein
MSQFTFVLVYISQHVTLKIILTEMFRKYSRFHIDILLDCVFKKIIQSLYAIPFIEICHKSYWGEILIT